MPRILSKKISDLHSDPANVRTHNDKNIEAIMASLKRFGQQKPIIIDSNNIVRAGNGTLSAAKKLGWEKIDTVKSNLEPSELTAYAIADNRTAELAEWDLEGLEMQLGDLDLELRDVAYEGFEFSNVDTKSEPSEKDDEIPETQENEFGVKRGDIWLLGAYYQCESCDKAYSYEQGKEMKECPCG